VALDIRDQLNDIWIWDLAWETLTRLTSEPTLDRYPVWTPDSRRVLFAANRDGEANMFWKAADGTGVSQRLTHTRVEQVPMSVSPDGAVLVFRENVAPHDLMLLAMDQNARVQPL